MASRPPRWSFCRGSPRQADSQRLRELAQPVMDVPDKSTGWGRCGAEHSSEPHSRLYHRELTLLKGPVESHGQHDSGLCILNEGLTVLKSRSNFSKWHVSLSPVGCPLWDDYGACVSPYLSPAPTPKAGWGAHFINNKTLGSPCWLFHQPPAGPSVSSLSFSVFSPPANLPTGHPG